MRWNLDKKKLRHADGALGGGGGVIGSFTLYKPARKTILVAIQKTKIPIVVVVELRGGDRWGFKGAERSKKKK